MTEHLRQDKRMDNTCCKAIESIVYLTLNSMH